MKRRFFFSFVVLAAAALAPAQRGQGGNPFAAPAASLHYAPDRQYDLLNVYVETAVDYKDRKITGHVVNTLTTLRNGLTELKLMAGPALEITKATVNGAPATFRRDGRSLYVKTAGFKPGVKVDVALDYSSAKAQGGGFGAGGGWHWVQPRQGGSNGPGAFGASNLSASVRVGFWTQGETESNSDWVPTWDYPSDLATSETKTTVPADWTVIGNGLLVSKTFDAKAKTATYDWKMTLPHATYLLSLCGGPFDVKKDTWEGVQLWYVVPRGAGRYIDTTYGHTKDMLTFYSSVLGFKYAWPKYAQDGMFDFGGGMENVSATTLGEGSLTEPRDGYFTADSVNSHELGHQWFGDTVTCKDWGDIYLNESFATFMQMIYFEHSRGSASYQWEVEDNSQGYFRESRRYKRPLSTKFYSGPDAMFDQHTYPKGGVILHTLRRMLGDAPFFGGLQSYLNKWQHTPVESAQLRRAFIESTGVNVEPFWKQWIDSPGHPVLDYTWVYEDGKLKLTVKQTQDTSDGTPVYDIQSKIGYVAQDQRVAGFMTAPVHLSKTEETFEIAMPSKPLCVVLDPDHDFLREIPTLHWAREELPYILAHSHNAPDRSAAMLKMLDNPSDDEIRRVTDALRADNDPRALTFRSVVQLANLKRPELRSFWMSQLDNPNLARQAQAVQALGQLERDPETTARLRALVNDTAPIQVVINAITALAAWDKSANADVIKKAQGIADRRGRIKRVADQLLGP